MSKEKAQFILKNEHLFTPNNKEVAKIAISIASQITKIKDYKISPKQLFILNKAYEFLSHIVKQQDRKRERFNKLSDIEKLWETHSSSSWVDDEGPSRSMSFDQFEELYTKLNKRIKKLEKRITEFEQEVQ